MVQVRRLLDVLPILPRRKDERRFGELPSAKRRASRFMTGPRTRLDIEPVNS